MSKLIPKCLHLFVNIEFFLSQTKRCYNLLKVDAWESSNQAATASDEAKLTLWYIIPFN